MTHDRLLPLARGFRRLMLPLTLGWACPALPAEQPPVAVSILDAREEGHDGAEATALLKNLFEQAGGFRVEVRPVPSTPDDSAWTGWRPAADTGGVVVAHASLAVWPAAAREALTAHLRAGGGLIALHGAALPVPDWPDHARMLGLAGDGESGRRAPLVYIEDGKVVFDRGLGETGRHRAQREYRVESAAAAHPITAGLPPVWMHTRDKLFDSLRLPVAPAVALAFTRHEKSGLREPVFVVAEFGRGRVFRTPFGHAGQALRCGGLREVLARAAEWAASGRVTRPVPSGFPDEHGPRLVPVDLSAGAKPD